MMKFDVDREDLLKQVRKLDGFEKVAREELTKAMDQTIGLSLSDQRARAPIASGQLVGSLRGEIKFAMGDEVRGVMSADARGANGFPYGYALNVSKQRVYHYAGTKRKTLRWFSGAQSRKRKEILAFFETAIGRIVQRLTVK